MKKIPKRRNKFAKSLADPRYGQRVIPTKKQKEKSKERQQSKKIKVEEEIDYFGFWGS